jgi:hypothetical protein
VIFASPWLGVGYGAVSLHNRGDWKAGPAFGIGAGIFFPKVHFGFSAGAYWMPMPAPGDAAGHNDLGMYYGSIILGADVG